MYGSRMLQTGSPVHSSPRIQPPKRRRRGQVGFWKAHVPRLRRAALATSNRASLVSSTYFNYWDPSWNQYAFLFLACFLLFMIKLLYVNDTNSIAPHDHALLYNRAAGCCFQLGNFALLLFTTVLGAGEEGEDASVSQV